MKIPDDYKRVDRGYVRRFDLLKNPNIVMEAGGSIVGLTIKQTEDIGWNVYRRPQKRLKVAKRATNKQSKAITLLKRAQVALISAGIEKELQHSIGKFLISVA